jgi:putative spermidine/putrescine transport system permease protein
VPLILNYPLPICSQPYSDSQHSVLFVAVLDFTSSATTAWTILLQDGGSRFFCISGITDCQYVGVDVGGPLFSNPRNRGGPHPLPLHSAIYSVMKTISPSYMRAAKSLGATPFHAFIKVYMPQTLPGVAAGCLLTFILCLGFSLHRLVVRLDNILPASLAARQ